MQFINSSDAAAIYFPHRDQHGVWQWIVVIRITASIQADGSLTPITPQPSVNFAEVAYGDVLRTPLKYESDIAPIKPKVDLVINANAYSPGNIPVKRFAVSLTVRAADKLLEAPLPPVGINDFTPASEESRRLYNFSLKQYNLKPYQEGEIIFQRELVVTGKRFWRYHNFLRRSIGAVMSIPKLRLINNDDWLLTEPEPTTMVPLRYDYAYGGLVELQNGAKIAFNDNPVGKGYIPTTKQIKNKLNMGLLEADDLRTEFCRRVKLLPAPQVEHIDAPLHSAYRSCLVAGWGTISKPWAVRRKKAGTFDKNWMDTRYPLLPADFDANYWNGAISDLQFDYLPIDSVIELQNLVPVTRMSDQKIRIRLPSLIPEIEYLDYFNEIPEVIRPRMDTVRIDLLENELTLLYRAQIPIEPEVFYMELRLEQTK